jgi:PqqD family protein of HPr-rel-A system
MIKFPQSLAVSQLDDELVLLDEKTGKYFGLNPVGSRIFQLLKESGDEAQVVAALSAEYDAPKGQLTADVAAFISTLAERGLIVDDAS